MVDLRNISDRELLDRRFWLSVDEDPETLPNLIRSVREGQTESLQFEYAYDRSPPLGVARPFIHCAHCGAARHHRGYVLRYPDGAGVLIGKDCGAANYDIWWHKNEAEFRDRIVRGATLQKIQIAAANLPAVVAELEAMRGQLSGVIGPAEQFRARFPSASGTILDAANGRFMAPQEVRDYDAERQRDDRLDRIIARRAEQAGMPQEEYERQHREALRSDPDLQKPPLYKEEMREIAAIRGHKYFTTALGGARENWTATIGRLEDASSRLSALIGSLETRNTDSTTDALINDLSQLRAHLTQAQALWDALSGYAAFFDTANLASIARALMHAGTNVGAYSVENGAFVLTLRTGQKSEFRAPMTALSALDRLRELVRALEQ